jgi:hypothetical protein
MIFEFFFKPKKKQEPKKGIQVPRLSLNIPKGWEVNLHNFFEVDPRFPYPQEVIADHLSQYLFQATSTCGKYTIDVGFYGEYDLTRKGTFTVYLIRGDFHKGELLEKYRFEQHQPVVECVNKLMNLVVNGAYEKLDGLSYSQDAALLHFREYSVTRKIALTW